MNDSTVVSGLAAAHGSRSLQAALIREGQDAPRGRATPYEISPGDTFHGALDQEGDRDWISIELTEGEFYSIALYGVGGNSLYDPHLRLYGANGRLVDGNDDVDDDSGDLDSLLSFTADRSGTYYLSAGAYDDAGEGDYALQVTALASLDELADYLTDGFWEQDGQARRSFDTTESNEITVDLTELNSAGRKLARWALEAWETVADLTFREVRGGAQILFDDIGDTAEANSNTSGGPIPFSTVNVPRGWLERDGDTIDSYAFSTYVHEIGHALGLGHPGPYNQNAEYGRDNVFLNDSYQLSVMSYFSQDANTAVEADWAQPVSAMMADIVAIQNLYGSPAAASATGGDTVYGADATIGGYLGALFATLFDGGPSEGVYAGGSAALTLFDRDGVDTIDLSTSDTGQRLDLRPTRFSDIGGTIGNLGIARGTWIENAVGGTRKDRITGNDRGNELHGGAGGDLLKGLSGQDLLRGNGAGDRLLGSGGADALFGGAGSDKLRGGGGDDRAAGGAGDDEISGGGGADTFIFGLGHGRDRVRDFDPDEGDRLQLDDDLWTGDLSAEEVIAAFGSIDRNGDARLSFDGGDRIEFAGLDLLTEDLLVA